MKKEITNLPEETRLEYAAELMRALAHPLRLRILELVDKNKSLNVTRIYDSLGIEQSMASQQLRILRLAGFVQTERQGKNIFYTVNYDFLGRFHDTIKRYLVYEGK